MNLLHLVTSLNGPESSSYKLGNSIINKLQEQNEPLKIKTTNLAEKPFPHLEVQHLSSFFTPEQERTPEMNQSALQSDLAIKELQEADVIIIDVPMYNFSIPSTLKTWIDHITRAGITFQYSENGVEGLVKNKKVFLAISSGGIYSEGVMKEFDFTENYLRKIFGFIGIEDITAFRVEGLAIPELKEQALPNAIKMVEETLA